MFFYFQKVAKTFEGHKADVHQILPFASHLISVDEDNCVKIWTIDTAGIFLWLIFVLIEFFGLKLNIKFKRNLFEHGFCQRNIRNNCDASSDNLFK